MPAHSALTRGAVTRALVIGSIVIGAFGGATVDRAVVATPARRHRGAEPGPTVATPTSVTG